MSRDNARAVQLLLAELRSWDEGVLALALRELGWVPASHTDEDVTIIAAQLAVHPVLALLALQDDGAPEAESQIRDCAEKIAAALAKAGRLQQPPEGRVTTGE